jgi:hypothetical protein
VNEKAALDLVTRTLAAAETATTAAETMAAVDLCFLVLMGPRAFRAAEASERKALAKERAAKSARAAELERIRRFSTTRNGGSK